MADILPQLLGVLIGLALIALAIAIGRADRRVQSLMREHPATECQRLHSAGRCSFPACYCGRGNSADACGVPPSDGGQDAQG